MNLDFFEGIKNKLDNKMSDFLSELSESLKNMQEKSTENKHMSELNNNREEDCLYYVIDSDLETVYLQNLNTNITFKETDIPKDIKSKLFTDCFLRYKNGEYIWEKQLTEKYWNTLVNPKDYERIKGKFIEESGIEKNNPNTNYYVLSNEDEKDYTVLYYDRDGQKTIEVPNVLMPFGVDNEKVYKYKDGKFELNVKDTRKNKEK